MKSKVEARRVGDGKVNERQGRDGQRRRKEAGAFRGWKEATPLAPHLTGSSALLLCTYNRQEMLRCTHKNYSFLSICSPLAAEVRSTMPCQTHAVPSHARLLSPFERFIVEYLEAVTC